jgi:site-specific DNA-cytosine methylase
MLRAIKEIQPTYVVGENVPGLLNWKRGMVLAEIVSDLEAAGFEVFPPVILPACGKNAPHRRDRLYVIAHCNGINRNLSIQQWRQEKTKDTYINGVNTNHNGTKLQRRIIKDEIKRQKHNVQFIGGFNREWFWPTTEVATRLCRMDARVPKRMDRIKVMGNSVNPYSVCEIFKVIEEMNNITTS